jgi:hypothetical protein
MPDKFRCDIFHEFDGHCCGKDEPCPFRPKTAVEAAAVHSAAQRGMLAGLVFLTVVLALFGALLVEEQRLERVARQDQEVSVRW